MLRRSKALNVRLHDQARILLAAVVIMDGRSSPARDYKRLAKLLLDARTHIDVLQTQLNSQRGGW
jgi:hypothetical protein